MARATWHCRWWAKPRPVAVNWGEIEIRLKVGDFLVSPQVGVQLVTLPLPRRVPNSVALIYGLVREALRPFAHNAPNMAIGNSAS